jgi:hypothetical protein
VRPDAGSALALYYAVAGFIAVFNLGIILTYRSTEKQLSSDDQ